MMLPSSLIDRATWSAMRPPFLPSKSCSFLVDSYRVLGAARGAGAAELRSNMALLMRWLHPDVNANGARLMLAARVTRAWETVKTPDRRAAYDRAQAASKRKSSSQKARAMVKARRDGQRGDNAIRLRQDQCGAQARSTQASC